MICEQKTFSELSSNDLFEVLKLRQQVFIIEQNCIYQDIDDIDKEAYHILTWNHSDPQTPYLSAYLRIIPSHIDDKEVAIGRVVVAKSARGIGLGKALIERAIAIINDQYQGQSIKISAQQHLERFYASLEFKTVSEPYDEDGIPHIKMIKRA